MSYLPLVAGLALLVLSRRSRSPSAREDTRAESASSAEPGLPAWLAESLDAPYSWGGGAPWSSWPDNDGRGWDCSGYVQAAAVQLGLLSPEDPDRSAQGLWEVTAEVKSPALGDLAFYGPDTNHVEHVMLTVGDGRVIGASGGTSRTHGDDPNAKVKVFSSHLYRGDFLGFGRL